MTKTLEEKKDTSRLWFKTLRDKICKRFETLEKEAPEELFPGKPGCFDYTEWKAEARNKQKTDPEKDGQTKGGGTAGMLRGRLFEKAGVHISTVYGTLPHAFATRIKGAEKNPTFWASGISLIAHMRSPKTPAVHMNTRFIVTAENWFGGGADLTPLLRHQRLKHNPDSKDFHTALKKTCDRFHPEYYAKYKEWCDRYFFLPHRNEARGIGGIFYDHHNSGNFERDLNFTQSIGTCFLEVFSHITKRRMHESWTDEEREEQLIRRGRYVEFNLLYDKGTLFGLKTKGNIETILSSMPPIVKWP